MVPRTTILSLWTSSVLLGFLISSSDSFILPSSGVLSSSMPLKGIVYGDDFAGYGEENREEEGEALAHEFYQEIKVRQDLANAMQAANDMEEDVDLRETKTTRKNLMTTRKTNSEPTTKETNPRAIRSAGLFKGKRRMSVFSAGGRANNRGNKSSAVPLPPTPTYGSPVQLSISGIIAVVLLSRFFWVQALVSAGLIALYVLVVIATSNGGGDWMGATTGQMDWSSVVHNGIPLIERTTTESTTSSTITDGDSSTSL